MAGSFEWPEGKKAALSISFDDSRGSQIENGIPILDSHNVKATFYIVECTYEQRMDAWKSVAAGGHELGNHTVNHPCGCNFGFKDEGNLEDLTLDAIAADIDEATIKIQDVFELRPATFAYPCGQQYVGRGKDSRSYTPVVSERFVVGRGFRNEASNLPACMDLARASGTDFDGMSFETMKRQLEGAVASGRWIIFAGHDVGPGGGQTVIDSALDELCGYASDPSSEIWVDTVAEVGRYVQAQQNLAT
jgi:hypothetical protein